MSKNKYLNFLRIHFIFSLLLPIGFFVQCNQLDCPVADELAAQILLGQFVLQATHVHDSSLLCKANKHTW